MRVRLEALKETKSFYDWELKKKGLTKKKRNKFLKALKIIEGIIKKREKSGENKNDYKGDVVFKN